MIFISELYLTRLLKFIKCFLAPIITLHIGMVRQIINSEIDFHIGLSTSIVNTELEILRHIIETAKKYRLL